MDNREQFMTEAQKLYDKVAASGVNPIGALEWLKRQINLPDEEGWKIIEDKLRGFGLDRFERNPKVYGYELEAYLHKDGPLFILDLVDSAPFKVSLRMLDSYYHPCADYDMDCGPMYIDWDEVKAKYPDMDFASVTEKEYEKIKDEFARTNDNWAPDELFGEKAVLEDDDKLFAWIGYKVKEWLAAWDEMEEWRL